MPESPTGGAEGRGNARPSGVARGDVRVDMQPDGVVTFVMFTGTVTDRIFETTMDRNGATYNCESGRSFSLPPYWVSGDTVPLDSVVWTTRASGGWVQRMEDRADYARNVFARNGFMTPETRGPACDCEICQQNFYGNPNRPPPRWPGERPRLNAVTAEHAEQERQRLEDRRKREAESQARAEETLRMVLRPDELAVYEKTGKIIITGADNRRYRISDGLVGNVWLLAGEDDAVAASLCCHPNLFPNGGNEPLPFKDAYAAQILYLRHDLDKFWAKANISWHSMAARDEYFDLHERRRLVERWRGLGIWDY